VATNVTQRVRVEFQEVSSGFMTALGGMGEALSRVTSMVNSLNVAIAGIGAGAALAGVAAVGSEYEDLRIQMAQTMRFMGRGGDTFADALESADRAIQQVYTAAAALPGEAEDYARALQLAGANVDRATGSYQKSFDLIRQMTAIGITMGHSAEETAHLLSSALQTQRGMLEMTSSYTVELINAMRELPGYANITTQQFNRMSLEERVRLMTEVTGQFDDMLQESAGTWSAVSGAAASTFRTLFRMASVPLFESMTESLERVSTAFIDADGNMTDLGRGVIAIGEALSSALGSALEYVTQLFADLAANARSFVQALADSPIVQMIDRMANGLESAVGAMDVGGMAGAAGGAFGAGAAIAATTTGPVGAIMVALGAGFANLLTRTEAVSRILDALGSIGETLVGVLGPILGYFSTLGQIVGGLLAGVLPGLLEGISMLLEPILAFATGMITIVDYVYGTVAPGIEAFGSAIGNLLRGIASILAPIIRLVGHIMLTVYDTIASFLAPAINFLVELISLVIDALGDLLNFIGEVIGEAINAVLPEETAEERPETRRFREMLDGLADSMAATAAATDEATEATRETTRAPTAPGGRGGGRIVQDFRGSRFDIQQRFEEGFDPDRIAVAFANDLGRIGTRRLQSGLEPAFGVR